METEALAFYDNSQVIAALQENAALAREGVDPENDRYARNRYSVENRLYNMRRNQRYIVNIQFVSPTEQYRMVEGSGFTGRAHQRHGEILSVRFLSASTGEEGVSCLD